MLTEKSPKIPSKYFCKLCHYNTSNAKDYKKHLSTRKHKMLTHTDAKIPENPHIENLIRFTCECGREYKHRQSLHVHKKKCTYILSKIETIEDIKDINDIAKDTENGKLFDMVKTMMKEMTTITTMNKELFSEIVPKLQSSNFSNSSITNNTTNNTTNHTTHNSININVFLNEHCKDAMNLTDFIDSIQLSIEDVTNIGEQGQTSGFANILINKLSSLDLYKRPLHCSDSKRETLYVKNNNEWNKESEDHPHLKDAIEHISRKGMEKVPELDLPDNKITDTVVEIVKMPVNHKKIISKVAKEVKI